MLRDACYILDLEKVPPMYVNQDPQPNAMCIGLDEPIIVVTTGLVELLDEEEMRAVVGHEVGHALSGHSVYRTILLFLTNLALRVAWIPLGNLAIMAIVTALREWFRKSELSADRAGLLVGQDLKASMRGLMKIAGGNHLHEMNVDAFLKQAEEYEAGGDLRDSVLKILNVLPRTHPFTTVRAAELKKWAESRDYQRIMDGHYPRRNEDKDTSVTDSFRQSAAQLRRRREELQGPADEAGQRHRGRRGRPRRPGPARLRRLHRRRAPSSGSRTAPTTARTTSPNGQRRPARSAERPAPEAAGRRPAQAPERAKRRRRRPARSRSQPSEQRCRHSRADHGSGRRLRARRQRPAQRRGAAASRTGRCRPGRPPSPSAAAEQRAQMVAESSEQASGPAWT